MSAGRAVTHPAGFYPKRVITMRRFVRSRWAGARIHAAQGSCSCAPSRPSYRDRAGGSEYRGGRRRCADRSVQCAAPRGPAPLDVIASLPIGHRTKADIDRQLADDRSGSADRSRRHPKARPIGLPSRQASRRGLSARQGGHGVAASYPPHAVVSSTNGRPLENHA
jgi:hypothetical protein